MSIDKCTNKKCQKHYSMKSVAGQVIFKLSPKLQIKLFYPTQMNWLVTILFKDYVKVQYRWKVR